MNRSFSSEATRPRPRRRRWLESLLLMGFFLCLLVGLAALVAFWRLYSAGNAGARLDDPLASLRATRIEPPLALAELAGDPAEALAYQALQAGHLETARAIITFRRPVDGGARLSLLLKMAQEFAAAGEPSIAVSLFYQSRAIAILDASLSPAEQSQALVQVTQGLLAAGERAAARDSAAQAYRVARLAPTLLPAQRSQLFANLQPLVDQLDDPQLRQQLNEFARNPFLAVTTTELAHGRLWQLVEPLAHDTALSTAIATRHQRARELVNRMDFTGGADIEPEQVALAQALLAEDRARGEYVGAMQQAGLTSGQQAWLLLEQRDWLLLKVRIASLGFGLSLAPEWEANRAALLRETSAVTNALDNALQAVAGADADPTHQALMTLEAHRWLALQHELGHYPESGADALSQRIRAAEETLAQLGNPVPFPIAYDPAATPPGFRIQQP